MSISLRLLALTRPVVFIAVLSFYLARTDHAAALMALYSVSAAFYLASSSLVAGWVPAPERVRRSALGLEVAVVTLLNWAAARYAPGGPMAVLYAPIAVSVALDLGRAGRTAAMAVMTLGWLLSVRTAWPHLSWPAMELGVYGTLIIATFNGGLLVRHLLDEQERSASLLRRLQESQSALERAHRQLQESAARQREMAVLEERQRLAREIHDGVAHGLTALVVQAQAARRLLALSPAEAEPLLERCEDLAREALRETRLAVRALHPGGLDESSEAAALGRLARDFGLATGMEVEVRVDDAARSLPPDAGRLEQLYRIFQEALTNAHRHGGASRVEAWLTAAGGDSAGAPAGELRLVIRNNGRTPPDLTPGLGLRAMKERAGALGGTVQVVRLDPGLEVRVTVPITHLREDPS